MGETARRVEQTEHSWFSLGLGCTDTPFLVLCLCATRVGHRNEDDVPNFDVWRCPFFFFFFGHGADAAPTRHRRSSDASDTPTVEKKNHRF